VDYDSGAVSPPAGDISDIDNYPYPTYPIPTTRPRILGEHGVDHFGVSGHECNSINDTTGYIGSMKYVKWPGAESAAPLLAPYPIGAHTSPLVSLLEAGHRDDVMTKEEMEKICCWIDLQIPFKGDYAEFLANSRLVSEYNYWANNRKIAEAEDAANIVEFIKDGQPGSGGPIVSGRPGPFDSKEPALFLNH
jgi:hypothetical protein